jgi:hypothetical protein
VIIGITHKDDVTALVTYDGAIGAAGCVRTFHDSRHELADLWHPVFDYVADRARQGRIEKLVLYGNGGELLDTARLFGLLTALAAEFRLPLIQIQWVDEHAEADAWRMLPGKYAGQTAVALALGAALVSMDGVKMSYKEHAAMVAA